MKSLVALLDRKKRSNTLVPAPLPSSLPLVASTTQERVLPSNTGRHVSTSDFLRPPAPYRATSNPDLPRYPQLHEPTTPPRRQSPVQSIAYHNDSDDDTLADPFAASPSAKLKPKLPPTSLRPPPSYTSARRGSTPNLRNPVPKDAFQSQDPVRGGAERNLSVVPCTINQVSSRTGVDSNESTSALAHDVPGKERRLRERRSFSNFFRQQAAIPVTPVPQVPPFPTRIPERKSSFFRRGRSGSTPAAAQAVEQAHTLHQLSATPVPTPARPQTTAASQPHYIDRETEPVTQRDISSLNGTSPDSWVRVGASHDQNSPSSPTAARRRALSVPSARPPKFTEPPLPVIPAQVSSTMKPNKSIVPRAVMEAPPIPRSEAPLGDRQVRPSRSIHGLKSASVSISSSHDAGCSPLESSLRRRPSLKHFKRPSASVSEGGHGGDSTSSAGKIIRKSALKRTSAQTQRGPHIRQEGRMTLPTEAVLEATPIPQLPTPASEGSLKRLGAEGVGHRRAGTMVQIPPSPSINNISVSSPRTPPSLGGTGSKDSSPRGHTLAPSDSRTLPVLDNIWGSFMSETAFGSLPPSPSDSLLARNRVAASPPGSIPHRRISNSPGSPESPRGPLRRRPWNLGSLPPGSPPVLKLPPLPLVQSPALAMPLGSVSLRKWSRSIGKRNVLLTPPVSPTEETDGIQGLDVMLSTSTSDNSLLASSQSGSGLSSMGSRELPQQLTRSLSSPVLRSPPSPVSRAGPDAVDRSWLSVDIPRSRSISPSPASLSSSQSTPVPGTPIGLPLSAANQTSYPGISRGISAIGRSEFSGKGGHVKIPWQLAQVDDLQSCGLSAPCVPMGDSEVRLSMFPTVPLGISEPYAGGDTTRGAEHAKSLPVRWSEESLPTPPVTPAWFAQVFDDSIESERECVKIDGTRSRNEIPLMQLGSLARTRRQRHVQNTPSSSSNEASSDGTMERIVPLLLPRRTDGRSGVPIDKKHMGRRF